jgi:hypothetical protein
VDGNVADFQALDSNFIYVLGTDGNLWFEHSVNGKFGQIPPPRGKVDANVMPPLKYGTVRPSYQILMLVYAPPGTNGGKSTSMVDYGSGSSTDTTTSTSSSFKDGIDISASVGGDIGAVTVGANVDFSFSKPTTKNDQVESKKSQSSDIKLQGPTVRTAFSMIMTYSISG